MKKDSSLEMRYGGIEKMDDNLSFVRRLADLTTSLLVFVLFIAVFSATPVLYYVTIGIAGVVVILDWLTGITWYRFFAVLWFLGFTFLLISFLL